MQKQAALGFKKPSASRSRAADVIRRHDKCERKELGQVSKADALQ
jgi:hypothetical protein